VAVVIEECRGAGAASSSPAAAVASELGQPLLELVGADREIARHAQPAGELDRPYPGCGERGTGGRIVALGTWLRPDHRPLGCGEARRAHGSGILREGEVEAEGHRIHAQHHVVSDLPRRETLADPA
jgi:hypothetical protein